jgi:hypothetical protein
LESGLPDYLRQTSWSQQYGTILAVVATAAVWMGLVLTDDALWDRGPAAVPAGANAEAIPVPVAVARVPENAPPVAPAPEAPPAAAAVAAANSAPAMPAPGIPAPEAAPPGGPQAGPAGIAAPGEVAMVKPPAPAVEAPAAPANPVLPITQPERTMSYQSGDELAIKKLAMSSDWQATPTEIPIELLDEFASPAPFRNTYGIPNVIDVTLEPGTRVQRLPRVEGSDVGLLLDRGQLTLIRPGSAMQPVGVKLKAGRREWIITLLDPDTRCSLEVIPPVPSGPTGEMTEFPPEGGLVVTRGKIRIGAPGQKEPQEIGEKDGYARWPLQGTKLVQQADLAIPGWALPDGVIVTPAARQLARMYQKEFGTDKSVLQSIGPVVKDRRATMSELAVKTLALMDQYQALAPALGAEHQEARVAAIQGLRQWLLRDPGNGMLLREELGKAFRAESVDPIVRLLWGFSVEDAKNPDVSRRLVDWLKDDQTAIRELAFFQISRLTGRTYDYLPMGPVAERRAGVQRWEDYLKRNNGSLLPP